MMEETDRKGHSEEYFTQDRDYWYNNDFLDLMAKRWALHQYSSMLDIGAGLCHWSKLLIPYLQPNSQITALDNDIKWAQGSAEITDFFKANHAHLNFIKGDAHTLPFPDHSFDVVTCQTVLIHLRDPLLALREMKRVVKKNGIVICAEPSNRIQSLIQDTSNINDKIDDVLKRVRQDLAYEQYKISQNNGNSSFGDLLSGAMNELGFNDIQAYLNDKLVSIYPPYDKVEQQAKINYFLNWGKAASERKALEQSYKKAVRDDDYMRYLKYYPAQNSKNKVVQGLKNQTYASGGATLLYLISGKA